MPSGGNRRHGKPDNPGRVCLNVDFIILYETVNRASVAHPSGVGYGRFFRSLEVTQWKSN